MKIMRDLTCALKQSIPLTCRWFIGLVFILYGLPKLTFGQFHVSFDQIADIAMKKGEGFALTWAFFSHSRVYEVFIGLGEIAAAILLMIPRTSTLGAVVTLPITANIMMINYCYQIGVQDLSTLLVLMNLFLLWIDRSPLMRIFWKHEPMVSSKGEKAS